MGNTFILQLILYLVSSFNLLVYIICKTLELFNALQAFLSKCFALNSDMAHLGAGCGFAILRQQRGRGHWGSNIAWTNKH